jgi:small subunit ribosomal protein S6
MKVMKKYELVVLFPTSVNDVVAEKRISDFCEKRKVMISSLNKWGVKPLAYSIKKQEKAYYLFYELEAEGEGIAEFDKDLRMEESILRYLLVVVDDKIKKEIKKGKEKK